MARDRKTRKDSVSSTTSISSSSSHRTKTLKKVSCSKFIEKILTKLIMKQTNHLTKHQTTISKWCNKMKSSILKKISLSTRVLFQSPETNIHELKKQIKEKTNDILLEKQKLVNIAKEKWAKEYPNLPQYKNETAESIASQQSGLFDDSVTQINEKIEFMGNRISSLSSDLETRLHAMDGLIEVVQNGRKSSNKSGRQTRSTKSKETPVKQAAPTMVTRKRMLPIQALNKTLSEG